MESSRIQGAFGRSRSELPFQTEHSANSHMILLDSPRDVQEGIGGTDDRHQLVSIISDSLLILSKTRAM